MEDWRRCKDYPVYEVSNTGKVRNRRTGRIMRTSIGAHGYETLQLYDHGKNINKRVHRLVAEAFYEGEHIGLDVNHIDGNKLNNNIENLEFCTRQENVIHSFKLGLSESHKRKRVIIEETGQIFDSITECAEYLGVDRSSVGCCVNGRSKTCCGYHISFYD